MDSAASTSKGARTPPRSLSNVLKTLWMEEENSNCPPFHLSFETFNYNIHIYLVDSSVVANIMPLFIAKKIKAQWNETSARIIQLDQASVLAIGELQYVTIWLYQDGRVHQCINIIFVGIPEAYVLLLSKDWYSKLNGYFATDWSHIWLPYKGKWKHI